MASIISQTQAITSEENMRDQTKDKMQPYANWEEYLTPAPLSIAILGELVFISSKTDFSINKNPPKNGFKLINHPDSFRACLMQVCHFGWRAFNTAHKNMDQIRLQTALVPEYMKTALEILFKGDDEVVEVLLPDQLENIQDISNECVQLSIAAEKGFTDVIDLTQELLEACTSSKHSYGEEMEKNKRKLEENKRRKQSAEKAKEMTEKVLKNLEKELDQAHQNYQKAMDSIPSGWEMIGMNFVEGITQVFTTFLNGVAYNASQKLKMPCATSREEGEGDWIDEIKAYSKSAEILQYAQVILQQMGVRSRDDEINWKSIYDQKDNCTKTDLVKEQFQRIQNELENITDSPGKQQAQQLIINGVNVCQQLANYAPHAKCDKVESAQIIDGVLNFIQSARVFDTKSKDETKSPAISPKPPMMYKNSNSSGYTSTVDMVMQNARFNIEQSEAQLNKTAERYDKCAETLQQSQKELDETLILLENCRLDEIDFETTIKMLLKGMDAMGRVEEQWKKMAQFFQMISGIVEVSLSKTLKNFASSSKKTQKLSYNAKLFCKDLLYTQAFHASNIASLVHMISSTYVDVSNKHIMDRVCSLDRLMSMDASDPKFEHERHQLKYYCDEAQKGILSLVRKNKEDFERKSKARLEMIKQELLPRLTAVPPEQIKSIKEAVRAGYIEEENHTSKTS